MGQALSQRITNREQSLQAVEMRRELACKIAAHAPKAGAQATAIPGLTLYDGLHRVLAIPLRTSRASTYSFKDESA